MSALPPPPSPAKRRRLMLVALLIIFLPAALVMGSVGADRAGYCVSGILGNPELETYPYIQAVGPTHATVVWRTAGLTTGEVQFSPSGGGSEVTLESDEGRVHEVELIGLEPATSYTYTVKRADGTAGGTFTTAPAGPESSVTIGVIGDSGVGSEAQYRVAAQLAAIDPGLVLHTGDVVYQRGALCHYGPKFFDPYEPLLPAVPFVPVLGNHDLKAEDGQPWFDTFVLPANNPAGSEAYGSFDWGPVHVVLLDSELYHDGNGDDVAAQRTWLALDLEANQLPWTIVVVHRPPWSSTDDKQDVAMRDDLAPLFEEGGVDLVLSGHAHNYERSGPVDGIWYVVTGGGGAGLYDVAGGPGTVASAKRHHLLRIDADATHLSLVAIADDGTELDRLELGE